MDFAKQVELAQFPAGVAVTVREVPAGRMFRAVQSGEGQPERGLELLLTTDAVKMYGAGPTVLLALERLKKAAEAGLPAVQEDGAYARTVFVGD
ncbi:hypothetical protein [Deinococcus arenicola]|uniref:Uncharacterized protein n=1 Tax=Deinococcus arenicola TaxID=2994950 RepID=A0ABU4DPR5_9DEIO|nr:hypothetical protein [Deinococcus sp. ZS9-10]MDV6374412.1 hypothetical protein [Deinococcus sp. ZS9-10]